MGSEGHRLLLSGQLLLIPTALLERKVGLSSGDALMCQNNLEELPYGPVVKTALPMQAVQFLSLV